MTEQIRNHLKDCPWGDQIIWFDTIDSTNTQAKALAFQGAPHGTVLIADHQTGGRGRLGRSFHSPAGSGIYLSLILRPNCTPDKLMHLTCATAVAMCDGLEAAAGIPAGIKWTNDLVAGQRKIAGILTELGLSPAGTVDYAVIGVGLNCCQQETDFPPEIRDMAGSLASVTGTEVDRAQVAAAMMEALYEMDRTLLTGKDAMLRRYKDRCITLNRQISLVRGDEVRHGTAVDIDGDGALIVKFADGHLEAVSSGEVSVRGMYGYV